MQNLHVDNLLRDYGYFKYLTSIHKFYFEENKDDATTINLVYYVDGNRITQPYTKKNINDVTCEQFQKELNKLKAGVSIECVTNNTVIDGK